MLPNVINKLPNLEHLDVSNNLLKDLTQINCMPKLQILNITGNRDLRELPVDLSTCDSLIDIILDVEFIVHPPREICERGTRDILNFLLTGEKVMMPMVTENIDVNVPKDVLKTTVHFIETEKGEDVLRYWGSSKDKYSKEKVV